MPAPPSTGASFHQVITQKGVSDWRIKEGQVGKEDGEKIAHRNSCVERKKFFKFQNPISSLAEITL